MYVHDSDIDGGAGLLAVLVCSRHRPKPGTTFHTPPELPMQLGSVVRKEGEVIAPHVHPSKDRTVPRSCETLLVRFGKVILDLYRPDGLLVGSYPLGEGDAALLVCGGHGLRFVTDADVLEVKQGPVVPNDKRYL